MIVEEIKLSEEDEIRYLKKLDNGYIKTINFLENHVKIFNYKFNINRQDFYLNNVRNGDSVYIYGILDANKTGLNYDMPSDKFNEPYLLIDNVRFENTIPNDISAYKLLNLLTAVGTLGTKFSKPHYYFGIGPFLNPINYFDYKKVKLFFSEEILIF